MKPSIIHIFHDVDLRCGHKGLSLYASKHAVSIQRLREGEFVMFVNASKTGVKLLHPSGVLVYLKQKHEIEMSVIESLPLHFKGTKFHMPRALKKAA